MSRSRALADAAVMSQPRRADHVPVTWRGMSVCGIRDDRIAWWREYYEDPVALSKAAKGGKAAD